MHLFKIFSSLYKSFGFSSKHRTINASNRHRLYERIYERIYEHIHIHFLKLNCGYVLYRWCILYFIMSVFRIKCKKIETNYKNLWEAKKITWSTGTAFAVQADTLITAYHVVEGAISIDVFTENSRTPYSGKCVAYQYEVDLAVIKLASTSKPKIFEYFHIGKSEDVVISKMHGTPISILGFTDNDFTTSITTGVISRIAIKKISELPQIVIQIDANITMGNSGGPVFATHHGDNTDRRTILGMVLGGISESKSYYMLPIFTIHRYLKNFDGKLPECCDLGITTKPKQIKLSDMYMECPMVTSVRGHFSPAYMKLYKYDVIITIDGHKISQYDLLDNGLPYWHIIREKNPGHSVNLEVLRNGETVSVIICLDSIAKPLLPFKHDSIDTHYYIFAGMDFMALNMKYFYPTCDLYDDRNSELLQLYHKYEKEYVNGETQIVILKSIFPSEITNKYRFQKNRNMVLTHINGKRMRNLKSVFSVCENVVDRKITFTLLSPGSKIEETIELDHVEALQSSDNISQTFLGKSYHNY